MAEIVTMAQEELRERGAADAAALAAKAVSGEADGTALIARGGADPHLAAAGLFQRAGGHPLQVAGAGVQTVAAA